ncbi:2-oxo acid dehydrogenase subunit E2 [soil metagenome]
MSDSVFMLPDLGEGLTSAEVVSWLIEEGDEIEVDQEIVTVETAKASVDVPSPYAGRVQTLHAGVGDTVAVGAELVTITPRPAAATTSGSGAVLIGYGTSDPAARSSRPGGRRRRGASHDRSPRVSTVPDAMANSDASPAKPVGGAPAAIKVISPLVRREAAQRGVDLRDIAPSDPDGIIRRADLERADLERNVIERALDEAATAPSDSSPTAPSSANPPSAGPGDDDRRATRIPLQGVRGAIAEKVSRSRREIPDATAWVDVDATVLMATASTLKQHRPDIPIGVLPLLARIVVAGLARFPELNASVGTDAQEIVQHHDVHLGIAMQTPRGLVVPVIKDAHEMTTGELAEALRGLTRQAREGSLHPSDLTGGTFTLNNYGVFGVDGSTPILNYPEAGMIGVGRIMERPWAVHGELAVRAVAQVSITFDHRVCDGGSAAGLLRFVADCMEQPTVLLANV